MDLAHAYQVMGCIVKRGDINPFSGAKMALRCKRAEEVRPYTPCLPVLHAG